MKLLKHVLALSIILILAATITSCVSSPEIIAARNAEKTQNWDEMIEHSLAAIETNPENPEGYYLLGQAYAGKKMYIEMIDAFDKSIETDPKFQTEIENQKQIYWSLILNEGVTLQQNQQFAEAAEKFLICTKLIPDHSMGFLYLGYANAGAGQDHKAIEAFQKSLNASSRPWILRPRSPGLPGLSLAIVAPPCRARYPVLTHPGPVPIPLRTPP